MWILGTSIGLEEGGGFTAQHAWNGVDEDTPGKVSISLVHSKGHHAEAYCGTEMCSSIAPGLYLEIRDEVEDTVQAFMRMHGEL